MISMVHLEGLEKRYPSQLSGGQQQMIALARALAIEPEALIETLSNYSGVTLFVTHNIEEAYRISKELVVLSSGKLEAKGEKEVIFKRPPTLITVQLTGCRNFSGIKYLSPFEIVALDWGIKLKVNTECKKDINYVGIRSHGI